MLKRRLAAATCVAVMTVACGADPGAPWPSDSAIGSSRDSLISSAGTAFWPADAAGIINVPVCFTRLAEQVCNDSIWTIGANVYSCDFDKRRQVTQSNLENTWGRYTNISFEGFGFCDALSPDERPPNTLVVTTNEVEDPTQPRGCQGGVSPTGIQPGSTVFVVSFCPDEFDNVSNLNQPQPFIHGRWVGVVVHEVGHSLGFHHEQDRPQNFGSAPLFCLDGANDLPAPSEWTPFYDAWSVMGYCTNNVSGWTGGPILYGQTVMTSLGDIEGAQQIYGVSPQGVWLRNQPAISHGLL